MKYKNYCKVLPVFPRKWKSGRKEKVLGFGIILLGYLLTLLDDFGAGIVGGPLMAWGFYKVSRINPRFNICAVISVVAMYEPVLQVLALLNVLDPLSTGFKIAHISSFAVKLCLIFTFYLSVIEIARVGKASKLEKGAMMRLYINAGAYLFLIVSAFIDVSGMQALINIAYVISGIINLLFIWDCASKITTREQMRKDTLKLKQLDDEERRKAEKRKLKNKED